MDTRFPISIRLGLMLLTLAFGACANQAPDGGGAKENPKTMNRFESSLPQGFEMPTDAVGQRILREYGAIFVARGVRVPLRPVFRNGDEVAAFQGTVEEASARIGEFDVVLQARALDALKRAIEEARATGKDITPRGSDASKRDYAGTVGLWLSRVEPGLKHWVAEGRLDAAEADRIRALPPFEQVPEILALEEKGLFFSKDLSKTILQSVAAPGTSQHLSMLALDIDQFNDKEVIAILNRNGWYQTVVSDLPHFTYLGKNDGEFSELGLKLIVVAGREYWIPGID